MAMDCLTSKWLGASRYCDNANLDIFWLRDDGIGDGDHLLDPDVLAAEIVEDLADDDDPHFRIKDSCSAVSYVNRGLETSAAKLALIETGVWRKRHV
jgi:hypothetical protein